MTQYSDNSFLQSMRAIARWLELRSFGLNPEQLNLAVGLRTALVVSVPLILVLSTHQTQFGWAIFSAFWTCLADNGGPKKTSRRYLLAFMLEGALIAFIASYCAGLGNIPAFIIGPALVLVCATLPMQKLASPATATLLSVVAVVAPSSPRSLEGAAMLAFAFFCGSVWANVVTQLLWPTDNWKPARRALIAVSAKLSDMLVALAEIGEGQHPDCNWHDSHSQHRRAVRLAIERARVQMDFAEGEDEVKLAALKEILVLQEALFQVCIALDHVYLSKTCPPHERTLATQATLAVMPMIKTLITTPTKQAFAIKEQIDALEVAASGLGSDVAYVLRGFAMALETYHKSLTQSVPSIHILAIKPAAEKLSQYLFNGVRTAASVALVYLVAHYFNFGYPYWATMAVVVVMQPAIRTTWSRSIERILGSVAGGLIALFVLSYITAPITLLICAIIAAGITMALRTVNYSIFVTFLTVLFVIVIELLQSGAGVASARIVDNVVGSLVAILAAILFWPNQEKQISELIQEVLAANRRYAEAVRENDVEKTFYARRAAGLASIEAETALYEMGGFKRWQHNLSDADIKTLMLSRQIAGEAAVFWHNQTKKVVLQSANNNLSHKTQQYQGE